MSVSVRCIVYGHGFAVLDAVPASTDSWKSIEISFPRLIDRVSSADWRNASLRLTDPFRANEFRWRHA